MPSRRPARVECRGAARERSVRALSSQFVRGIDDEEDAQHRHAGRHEVVRASRAVQGLREDAKAQSCHREKQSCGHAPNGSGGLFNCIFHAAPVYSHDLIGTGKTRRIYLQSCHYSREKIHCVSVLLPIKFSAPSLARYRGVIDSRLRPPVPVTPRPAAVSPRHTRTAAIRRAETFPTPFPTFPCEAARHPSPQYRYAHGRRHSSIRIRRHLAVSRFCRSPGRPPRNDGTAVPARACHSGPLPQFLPGDVCGAGFGGPPLPSEWRPTCIV